MAPVDKKGNELGPGDVISVRFRVTNVISDAQHVDLLCEYVERPHGFPEDLRVALESGKVELVEKAVAAPLADPVSA